MTPEEFNQCDENLQRYLETLSGFKLSANIIAILSDAFRAGYTDRERQQVSAPQEPLTSEQRLADIEARQRQYEQHDPGCPAIPPKFSPGGDMYMTPRPCTCWLSKG